MSYKALYRTYRPSNFSEVAGQDHVVKTLQHAVEQNKIAHAYLFCGPRGTGKTSIAKIFAKMVNCEDEKHKPCGDCENCQASMKGSHPDIIEIDAASNNGVEEVRNLIEKVKYAPLMGKYKIYIIDEVHMMSAGAFNALLKTIEEPPEHVIFILATTEPHKVLPTIISRCQRFDFTKVADSEIIKRLNEVLAAEKIDCEGEVVRIIAQLADGGLRDALSILDQCIAYAQNNIKVQHINEIYGIMTIPEKIELLDQIAQHKTLELLNILDTLIEKGIDIKRLTNDLIEILKETIIFEYTKEIKLLHILKDSEANHLINEIDITARFQMIDLLMETSEKYKFAASASSYFEVCLLKMIKFAMVQSDELIEAKPVIKPAFDTKNIVIERFEQIPNVSRETIPQVDTNDGATEIDLMPIPQETPIVQENKEHQTLDDEYILGLLSGANKPEKVQDITKFQNINQYILNLEWGKYANLIKHGTIVGAGSTYIVLAVDNQAEANQINDLDSNNEFCEFMIELLGKSKKIYAISKDQQTRVIQSFKERMMNGTLPEPIAVDHVDVVKKENIEKTSDELVLELFGKDNITIMED